MQWKKTVLDHKEETFTCFYTKKTPKRNSLLPLSSAFPISSIPTVFLLSALNGLSFSHLKLAVRTSALSSLFYYVNPLFSGISDFFALAIGACVILWFILNLLFYKSRQELKSKGNHTDYSKSPFNHFCSVMCLQSLSISIILA